MSNLVRLTAGHRPKAVDSNLVRLDAARRARRHEQLATRRRMQVAGPRSVATSAHAGVGAGRDGPEAA